MLTIPYDMTASHVPVLAGESYVAEISGLGTVTAVFR